MVTYDELANTNLSALDTVATDFEQMVRKWEYESDFQGDVATPLSASGWSGPAAQAAASQLTDARTQIEAAFNETSGIAKALRDAHDQFTGFQNTLRQIQHDAQTQGLVISADGSQITWTMPPDLPKNAGVHEDYNQGMAQEADAIRQRLATLLQQATDADTAAAAALAADTGTDQQKFNAAPVGGITEEQSTQAASQAASLASQGNKLTDDQLKQLDALLKAHANDPVFTTAFYNTLGPQGTLKFWGDLSFGTTRTDKPDQGRLDILKDMQAQLGTSLATATNTHSWPHLSDDWESKLRAAGEQPLTLANSGPLSFQPYGYQILGPLLSTGNFDSHFLTPIANDVTQMTKKNNGMWLDAGPRMSSIDIRTNFIGDGTGYNPMTSVLNALGHSPGASTDYFQNPDNLKFLTDGDKNPLFPDSNSMNPDTRRASESIESTALGHALQAGTTGVPWDAGNGTKIPQHTDATNAVMNQVVNTFGGNPSLLHGGPFASMNESVAQMTASYIGDVDKTINQGTADSLTTFGKPANLDQNHTFQLLDTLGRDPNSYGILQQAQNGYTAAQLHNTVGQPGNLTDNLTRVANQGSHISGILANARANEVYQHGVAADAAYNASVDRGTGIASTLYGMTLGSSVGSVPVVGPLLNNEANAMISDMGKGFHTSSTAQSVATNTGILNTGQNGVTQATTDAVRNALQNANTGLDVNSTAANIGNAAQTGYWNGVTHDGGTHQGGQ